MVSVSARKEKVFITFIREEITLSLFLPIDDLYRPRHAGLSFVRADLQVVVCGKQQPRARYSLGCSDSAERLGKEAKSPLSHQGTIIHFNWLLKALNLLLRTHIYYKLVARGKRKEKKR